AFGDVLNGCGFVNLGYGNPATSSHLGSGTAWGGGTSGPGTTMTLDCDTCHDVHGSSNYRLLKDKVNGKDVGGYAGDPTADVNPQPNPFVVSNEVGYPQDGFHLHQPYPGYAPNYTTARYAKPPGNDLTKGITGWCVACHERYATRTPVGEATTGRHPSGVPVSNWYMGGMPVGDRVLILDQTKWQQAFGGAVPFVDLPLEHDPATESGPLSGGAQVANEADNMGCLTCHRAHGTSARMTGFANVSDSFHPQPNTGSGGVPPANDSALLRADNRGVCERCHNK
ncbi:MAG: hypothetical protein M1335_06445, partial [Chloroflexi bacterium]|nr:hypothetical protein [Chloroflexota bacterium]